MVLDGPPLVPMVAELMSTSVAPSNSRTVVSTVRAVSMRRAAVVGIMSISLLMSRRTALNPFSPSFTTGMVSRSRSVPEALNRAM